MRRRGLTAPAVDASAAEDDTLLRRFVPQPLLDGRKKYDRVERVHGRDGQRQERVVKGSARAPCTNLAGRSRWYAFILQPLAR